MVEMTTVPSTSDAEVAREMGFDQLQALFHHPLERHYRGKSHKGDFRLIIFRRTTNEKEFLIQRKNIESHNRAGQVGILQLGSYKELTYAGNIVDFYLEFTSFRVNLLDEINARARENRPFEGKFVELQVNRVVAVLASMQQAGIAHRNVSLGSVYVTNTGLKLGEIGAPVKEVVVGRNGNREVYLSPMRRQMEQAGQWLIPNPFKGDVWALGVCVLAMLLLRLPRLGCLETLKKDIDVEIDAVSGQEKLKNIVRKMLAFEESSRPDFISLETQISLERSPFPYQPCPTPLTQSDINRLSITLPRTREVQAPPPPTEEPRCMFCSTLGISEPKDSTSFERPVRLYCNPENHVFCSRKCFFQYAQTVTSSWVKPLSTLKCKLCRLEIDSDLAIEALGGQLEYEKLWQKPAQTKCCYCKTEAGTVEMPCSHRYCTGCLRMMQDIDTPTVPCNVCQLPFTKKEISKNVKSGWWPF